LHRGARHVVAQGGALPRDVPGWLAIPGIGRYTAGAIVSAVWNTRVPILDGNVERVLCRLARIGEDTASGPVRARLWALADALLPTDRPGDCNQALMDLGATVCTPSAPDCPSCPLRPGCEAAGVGDVSRFPAAKHRPASPVEDRVAVVVFDADGRTLLRQRGDTGLLPRLWEPPNEERGEGRADEVARHIAEEVAASSPRAAGRVEHVFTHRIWRIDVFVATASIAPPGYAWVDEHASERPLPTATKKQIRIGRAAISEVGAGEATAAPSPARPRARTGSRRAPPHPA
jgi:A/G-specific adenine glycosylase